jgi:hypothetical protein
VHAVAHFDGQEVVAAAGVAMGAVQSRQGVHDSHDVQGLGRGIRGIEFKDEPILDGIDGSLQRLEGLQPVADLRLTVGQAVRGVDPRREVRVASAGAQKFVLARGSLRAGTTGESSNG